MVAGLHVGDALTNGLDDASAFVSENDGEVALGVLARERIGIYKLVSVFSLPPAHASGSSHLTCVANASVVNLDADLVGLGGSNLDVLNREALAGFPGNGSLAGNGLESTKSANWPQSARCRGSSRAYGGATRRQDSWRVVARALPNLTFPTVEAIVTDVCCGAGIDRKRNQSSPHWVTLKGVWVKRRKK